MTPPDAGARCSQLGKVAEERKVAVPPQGQKFQAAMDGLLQAHTQEMGSLSQENRKLREQVAELRESLRQVQGRIICSKIDEPKMHSLAQSVAEDVAEWVGRDAAAAHGQAAVAPLAKPAAFDAPAKACALDPEPSLPPDLDKGEFCSFSADLVEVVDPEDTAGTTGTSFGGTEARERFGEKRRRSWSKILSSKEAEEARRVAQLTDELEKKQKSPFTRALNNKLAMVFSTDSKAKEPGQVTLLQKIVTHGAFDGISACVIFFNSILIGVSTQYTASNLGEDDPLAITLLGHTCSSFFLCELVLRVCADGKAFFHSPETIYWNWFDVTLVVVSIMEIILSFILGGDAGGLASVKTIKMLRIMRLFRVFRFFKDLSLLALMVIDSMKSLLNALLMLVIITYVFAIVFTVQASNWLEHNRAPFASEEEQGVFHHFGDLWRTLYALMQAMLAGISWGELTDALMQVGWFSPTLFFVYVFFTMLAVLNIITGVFVDNAVETARTQRDYLVQKEMELKEMYVKEMQKLFQAMDEDESGTVTLQEVNEYFEDPNVKSYFTALGLDPQDSERLFSLLDYDGSGDVGVNEFIDGCLRLKGQARSIDLFELLLKMNRLEQRLSEVTGMRATHRGYKSRFSRQVGAVPSSPLGGQAAAPNYIQDGGQIVSIH